MNNPSFTEDDDGHTLSWSFFHNGEYLSFGICFDDKFTAKNTGWWAILGKRGNTDKSLIVDGELPIEFIEKLKSIGGANE